MSEKRDPMAAMLSEGKDPADYIDPVAAEETPIEFDPIAILSSIDPVDEFRLHDEFLRRRRRQTTKQTATEITANGEDTQDIPTISSRVAGVGAKRGTTDSAWYNLDRLAKYRDMFVVLGFVMVGAGIGWFIGSIPIVLIYAGICFVAAGIAMGRHA